MRSVSSATGDCSRIAEHLAKEDERENLEEFTQAKSDVDLIIRTEREELDAVLVSCKEDKSNIGKAIWHDRKPRGQEAWVPTNELG